MRYLLFNDVLIYCPGVIKLKVKLILMLSII